jgi:hypothetical protein
MRDVHSIDEDLVALAELRSVLRDHGVRPSANAMDQLLDERLLLMRDLAGPVSTLP